MASSGVGGYNSPRFSHRAALEPVHVRQPAVHPQRQAFVGAEVLQTPPADEEPRAHAVAKLHEHFPQCQQQKRDCPGRHAPAKLPQRVLHANGRRLDVAAFERQFAELAFDLGLGDLSLRQLQGSLELDRGLVVAAA
jgi:hypothetical protein